MKEMHPNKYTKSNLTSSELYDLTIVWLQVLFEDGSSVLDRTNKDEKGYRLREAIKAFCVYFEATLNGVSALVLKCHAEELGHIRLSIDECKILRNESMVVHDDGTVRAQELHLKLLKRSRFILNRFEEFFKINLELSEEEFELLDHAFRIRDRITHPWSADHLTITFEDEITILKFCSWCLRLKSQLMAGAKLLVKDNANE